jgi:uncharacterized protein (DUF1800 family)
MSRNNQTIDWNAELESIDPELAWSRWEPSTAEPWSIDRAALLYRRAGFGASEDELRTAMKESPATCIERLLGKKQLDSSIADAFEEESAILVKGVLAGGDSRNLASWWLHRLLHSLSPAVEKMTLFWHGHFATGAEKVIDPELMLEQNRTLRRHALGSFRTMVQEISKDPAMLIYLDSVNNRKAHANENYARELMELFCLGEGNYTEQDVQQLARCFTGWEIRRKQFRFNPYQHDSGKKSILGVDNIDSGEQAIDCVVRHQATPKFIVRKLFKFFLCDEPEPSDDFLAPLAATFVDSAFLVQPVIEKLLCSRLMLSGWAVGRKIRSPIDIAMGCLRGLQATTNLDALTKRLKPLGQSLFYPPNVKGWDGGRSWINSSTLIGRANLVHDMIQDENTRFDGQSLSQWCERQRIRSSEGWLTYLETTLLAKPLNAEARRKLLSDTDSTNDRATLLIQLCSLPQFHLS